jgi:hypothetical protein
VTYDPLAESRRLIKSGLPPTAEPLTRRRRFVALAVDVDGDAAATVFARRGAGTDWLEEHLLYCHDGAWAVHGGGASSINLEASSTCHGTATSLSCRSATALLSSGCFAATTRHWRTSTSADRPDASARQRPTISVSRFASSVSVGASPRRLSLHS